MTSGRNLITTILLAATVLFFGSRTSEAQDDTPSPRMLLNLDLFASHGKPLPGAADAGSDSMIEQIRALKAMGYLSPDGPLPDVDEDSDDPRNGPANGAVNNRGPQQ